MTKEGHWGESYAAEGAEKTTFEYCLHDFIFDLIDSSKVVCQTREDFIL